VAHADPFADHRLLAEAAQLAFRLAPGLCRRDPVSGESCAWLHGFWQCLRIAGLAATPDRHAAFYGEAFGALDSPSPRVLISGAADYCMLACVQRALPERQARITVIDSCDTPLELNRWYAERTALSIELQRCSVLDYAPKTAFDAICTHSFFGQFSRAGRPQLVAAWHRLLRPGGMVVTAHPLRPSGADEPNRFTPGQERVFREELAARSGELGGVLGVQPAEVGRLGEAYLRARYGYPVRSGEELAALFEAGGFEIEQLVCTAPAADAPPGSGGPGLRNPDVQYAHLIARRR
jgi:SAM-dependent methyltransferase